MDDLFRKPPRVGPLTESPRSPPMRLLALTDADAFGGAEQCLGYLLAELDPATQVAVAGVDAGVVERIAAHREATTMITVPSPGMRSFAAAIRAWRPTVAHLNRTHLYAAMGATRAAVLSPGVATVMVEHLPWGGGAGRRTLWELRALDRLVDAHVAVGERAARMVEAAAGYRPGSVVAVANGVPVLEAFEPPAPRPAAGVILGSLGRLTEQKGYDALIRALPGLPDVTLLLVGDGPGRAALEALATALGVDDRLVVTGWTDEPRRWLAAMDVFVLPSRWEGMPLSILEAMHAGLPVVASDVGSVAEAVSDAITGFLVSPDDDLALADCLRRLAEDPALRLELGTRGRARAAREFTAEVMAGRYTAVYEAALVHHVSRWRKPPRGARPCP